jgi:hypothetical protein
MVEFIFRPIDRWPQEPTPRSRQRHAHFRVNYNATLKLLSYELEKLGVKRAFIQADLREQEIRIDGQLRADAKPRSPRVIIAAETKHGPVSLPCNQYLDWQDNIRAIALSLEALRAVDRHGVTKRGEQYRGLKQLTAGDGPINTLEAAALLAKHCEGEFSKAMLVSIAHIPNAFEICYRFAAKKLHPDVAGEAGRPEWDKLQRAAAILRDHFSSSEKR